MFDFQRVSGIIQDFPSALLKKKNSRKKMKMYCSPKAGLSLSHSPENYWLIGGIQCDQGMGQMESYSWETTLN